MTIPKNRSEDREYKDLLSDEIGSGKFRTAYNILGCEDYINRDSRSLEVIEQEASNYEKAKKAGSDYRLGRIGSISKIGKYLVMERLEDLSQGKLEVQFPAKISDTKPSAFGQNSNGVRMRDYHLMKLDEDESEMELTGKIHTKVFGDKKENDEMKRLLDIFRDDEQ